MGKLPAPFRAVVFLRDMEGLSTRETAATLGISEDTPIVLTGGGLALTLILVLASFIYLFSVG